MGQLEILDVLERSELPMAGRQIAKEIGVRLITVLGTLRKLMKQGEVKCIELNRHKALEHFGSKRKLRLYYISRLNKNDLRKAKSALTYI